MLNIIFASMKYSWNGGVKNVSQSLPQIATFHYFPLILTLLKFPIAVIQFDQIRFDKLM